MSKVDIAVGHTDNASGKAIAQRLERAGHSVCGPFTQASQAIGTGALLAVAPAPIPNFGLPIVLLVPEEYELQDGFCPEAIVTEPLRGRELENAVALAVHRLDGANDRALVQA